LVFSTVTAVIVALELVKMAMELRLDLTMRFRSVRPSELRASSADTNGPAAMIVAVCPAGAWIVSRSR